VPIFAYECPECSAESEQLILRGEGPEPCEHCGEALGDENKMMSAPSFRLQPGVGWGGWKRKGDGTVTRTTTDGPAKPKYFTPS
jgi:predicted nucleic acid-binding Zn ribbon protein